MAEQTLTSQELVIFEANPFDQIRLTNKSAMEHYRTLNALEARRHPALIYLKASNKQWNCIPDILTSLRAFRIQNDMRVRDDACQKAWDITQSHFEKLPENEKLTWGTNGPIHCFEDDIFSQYDSHTHCIVELPDYCTRYSLQSYRGIATWYIIKWSDQPRPCPDVPESEPLNITFHPFYSNPLVPISWRIFSSLENLSAITWEKHHKNCHQNHFRVNVYLTGSCINGPSSKYTTHRVCGDTYVSDLFRIFLGYAKAGIDTGEPKDWQSFRQVQWDEDVKYSIDGTHLVQFGPLYDFRTVKASKVMIKDTQWFNGRDYVWLSPSKKGICYDVGLKD